MEWAGIAVNSSGLVSTTSQVVDSTAVTATLGSISGSTNVAAVGTSGTIGIIAGGGTSTDGVPATSASLDAPQGIVLDSSRNLLFSDLKNRIQMVPAVSGSFFGPEHERGKYVHHCRKQHGLLRLLPATAVPATSALLDGPTGVIL